MEVLRYGEALYYDLEKLMYYSTGNPGEGRTHIWLLGITVLPPAWIRRKGDS